MAKLFELLTEQEVSRLTTDQKKDYEFGLAHIDDEWARGHYGGWARAYEALERVGYRKVERYDGHRTFVHLEKPIFSMDGKS